MTNELSQKAQRSAMYQYVQTGKLAMLPRYYNVRPVERRWTRLL